MQDRGRAFRRHHRNRITQVEFRKRWFGEWTYKQDRTDESRAWAWKYAVRAQRTAKWCSCWKCGNNRKLYGNTKEPYTMQERRAAPYLKEQD